jgi:hypothetical protein
MCFIFIYLCDKILYSGYRWSPITIKKIGYDRFPPTINGWGIKYLVPDMIIPYLAEEEGPLT